MPALFNLAILRTTKGSTREAIDLYKHVIEIDSSYAVAHLNLGFLEVDDGQPKKGKAELAIAVQLDPSLVGRIPTDLNVTPVPEPTTSAGPQATATSSSSPD